MEELQTPPLAKAAPSPARDCTHRSLLSARPPASHINHLPATAISAQPSVESLEDNTSNGFPKHKSAGNYLPV